MKPITLASALKRPIAAIAIIAGVAVAALPGAASATRTAAVQPLVVFTDGTTTLGEAHLPPGARFDFTWTHNGCANGYQDPPIAALATKNGNLLTRKDSGGQVAMESPWVMPCVKGPKTPALSVRQAKPIIDIVIGPNGICITINGRAFGCDIWTSLSAKLEGHIWFYGGNTVDKGFVMKKGSKTTSGAVSVPRGTTHIDYYPGGTEIPYMSDPATTQPPPTNPGPLYFRRLPVHNLGSSGQDRTAGTPKIVGKRVIPAGEGADVMWNQKSCTTSEGTPLKFIVAAARPDPNKNVFMLSHLFLVPCISAGGTTRKDIEITVDVEITFKPFRVRPTIGLGLTGDTLLDDASVSAATVFSYGGPFSASAECQQGTTTCEKTKPTKSKPTAASYDLAVGKKV